MNHLTQILFEFIFFFNIKQSNKSKIGREVSEMEANKCGLCELAQGWKLMKMINFLGILWN